MAPFAHTIVTATGPEFQAVYDRMDHRKWILDDPRAQWRDVRGFWGEQRVQLLQCGLGPVTFSKNFQQSEVVAHRVSLIGVCGALREGLKAADVMFATEVTDASSGDVTPLGAIPILEEPERLGTNPMTAARFLCSSRIAENEPVKRGLGQRWGCDVVDMESAPFVRQAFEWGLRPLILKGVSDDVSEELPPFNEAGLESGEFDLQMMSRIWKKWNQDRPVSHNLKAGLGAVIRVFERTILEGSL